MIVSSVQMTATSPVKSDVEKTKEKIASEKLAKLKEAYGDSLLLQLEREASSKGKSTGFFGTEPETASYYLPTFRYF